MVYALHCNLSICAKVLLMLNNNKSFCSLWPLIENSIIVFNISAFPSGDFARDVEDNKLSGMSDLGFNLIIFSSQTPPD